MLFYPAALPLFRQTLSYVDGVIRRPRAAIGSCWRKLNPGQQALLVLVHLRKGETHAELAAGFGVGTATAWRYVTETVRLLAARAPKLAPALRAAKNAGHAFVIIDGTLAHPAQASLLPLAIARRSGPARCQGCRLDRKLCELVMPPDERDRLSAPPPVDDSQVSSSFFALAPAAGSSRTAANPSAW